MYRESRLPSHERITTAQLQDIFKIAPKLVARAEQTGQSLESGETKYVNISDLEHGQERKKILDEYALPAMRQVLRGLDHYFVFASTALYLQGQRIETKAGDPDDVEKLSTTPGDFDAEVFDTETLRAIVRELQDLPGQFNVINVRIGPLEDIPKINQQTTRVLRGEIYLEVEGKHYQYDFEFFLNEDNNDVIMTPAVQQHVDHDVLGFNVLNLTEGLPAQYQNNLKLDTKIEKNVQNIVEALTDSSNPRLIQLVYDVFSLQERRRIIPPKMRRESRDLLRSLDISMPDLAKVYELVVEQRTVSDPKAQQKIQSKLSSILGPIKTKVAKRESDSTKLREVGYLGNLEKDSK